MPTYEFRCNACRRKVTVSTKTYSEYDALDPNLYPLGSTDLTRLISRVAIKKSPIARMMSGGWKTTTPSMISKTPIRAPWPTCCAR